MPEVSQGCERQANWGGAEAIISQEPGATLFRLRHDCCRPSRARQGAVA